MKKCIALIVFCIVLPLAAQKSSSKKIHTINIKTNLSSKRGKVYIKVYPQGEEDCKKEKHTLPYKGSLKIKVPVRCCWRELKVVELGKQDKKKRVLGRVTTEEPICTRGSIALEIKEGVKKKGMEIKPIDIEAHIKQKKKKR